ncbi:KpsF/GutQ family sugar-phosphate isomerase [Pseudoroseicyclus aestuarii]|uniref:Arabinose-5-phosphate isomerase n=1 Tax=Pseudoroseicyclus aestuarii TaxID=1795041 RepID=A0A318SMY6_9RHOB|nr:KpsF/GutQ family sugar-phosphate isomerase [Pseudoroseicyclus aestuarii]PYE82194.1 arabinose-5-phosphate isomerase [Pseudoroseicyclus aestuarii]
MLRAAALASARRVLGIEAQALSALAASPPEGFDATVLQVLGVTRAGGRVIVSGIGKSGHVARKIAATLASTGTPALFVHPSEASHGDLGMIGGTDLCLLLSNSGETAELGDILAYSRRFSIPLVAISGRPRSTLATAADRLLLLPEAPEACVIGLAPTTTTTMMLALGDALAVALMEARGFRTENFRVLHPGGKLGAQMARADRFMHAGAALPLVSEETPMSETLIEMTSKGFGVAAVLDAEGRLSGIVTDGDLRRNMADLMDRRAGQIATRDPVTVPPEMLAAEALALLNARKIAALLVVGEDRRPLGLLHIHDLLRAGVA